MDGRVVDPLNRSCMIGDFFVIPCYDIAKDNDAALTVKTSPGLNLLLPILETVTEVIELVPDFMVSTQSVEEGVTSNPVVEEALIVDG